MVSETLSVNGVKIWKSFLDADRQRALVADLRVIGEAAPFRQYQVPGGRKMSVRMTGAGPLAWYADAKGYRYAPSQPDGTPWPDMPRSVLDIWDAVAGVTRQPDSCLLNYYGEGAKMGLHQDRDEADTHWPVVSVSLGDDALFRIGQTTRKGRTQSLWLQSGDVAVLSGPARLVVSRHRPDQVRVQCAFAQRRTAEPYSPGGRSRQQPCRCTPSSSRIRFSSSPNS